MTELYFDPPEANKTLAHSVTYHSKFKIMNKVTNHNRMKQTEP